MVENFFITNETDSTLERVPFRKIKDKVLGKKYSLSLVFIKKTTSKKLNNSYRGKNKPTNVLSFSLNKNEGEIFLTPEIIKKETKKFDKNIRNLTAFLFIHGLLHLKGMEHGSKMEKAEDVLTKKFGF